MQILHILPFDITDQSLFTFVSEFSILLFLASVRIRMAMRKRLLLQRRKQYSHYWTSA